jgi:hypothetical protein
VRIRPAAMPSSAAREHLSAPVRRLSASPN